MKLCHLLPHFTGVVRTMPPTAEVFAAAAAANATAAPLPPAAAAGVNLAAGTPQAHGMSGVVTQAAGILHLYLQHVTACSRA